jgi:D-serine deaminase-like pyridoxal phosphate-dependent protein
MPLNRNANTKSEDDRYFSRLSSALSANSYAQPTLLLDRAVLDKNIEQLQRVLASGFDYRLVVKSLPCVELIKYVLTKTKSQRLMCFHLPFLKTMVDAFPDSDILLGKPMTNLGLDSTLLWLKQTGTENHSIQWLVDSEERLQNYAEIAQKHALKIKINLEIDIGLGRGGFKNLKQFERALHSIKGSEYLCFSGLMGYEAHASKMPAILGGPESAVKQAQTDYAAFKTLALQHFNDENLCFNSAGSTTITHYKTATQHRPNNCAANELALGSALMKPTDFDLPSLCDFEPALYIAAPILKVINEPSLPGPALLSIVSSALGVLPQKAICLYGGNWLAQPAYPQGLERLKIFGHSSNQEMYALPETSPLQADDWVYFRPTQSEALMLQFGDITVIDSSDSFSHWPSLSKDSAR